MNNFLETCAVCAFKQVRCDNEQSKYHGEKVPNDFVCEKWTHWAGNGKRIEVSDGNRRVNIV